MGDRSDLQVILEGILGSDSVYFSPPESIQLTYPCIIYHRSQIRTNFANNLPYNHTKEYTLTVIYSDPDSDLPDKIAKLETARHERSYTTDMLNHDIFTLFF